MKGTELFKQTIETYLREFAERDEQFAAAFAKPTKSIDRCVAYILQEVKKSGQQGFADEEIYGLAVHYYDEDDIDESKLKDEPSARVVVNHHADAPKPETKPAPTPKQAPAKTKASEKKHNVQQLDLFA